MCGIAGVFDKKGIEVPVLKRMSRSLKHRGPDDEGYLIADTNYIPSFYHGDDSISEKKSLPSIDSFNTDKKTVLGLVHRRLSILDLSVCGHQPMSYRNGRFHIVYNGEIYNYVEIKEKLHAKGYVFSSGTDTEVILASYQEWGSDCNQHFMGMWAFAIYDSERKELFLSRDRFGIKPLYYFFRNGHFVFASEIKALLDEPGISRKLNVTNMVGLLSFGRIPTTGETLFDNIVELAPAHYMQVSLQEGTMHLTKYYDLKKNVNGFSFQSNRNTFEEYNQRFEESIMMHLRSDVPVGSCLSGGLDSSAIVSFASPLMGDSILHTFTAAYQDAQVDESSFAKSVSSTFINNKPHYTYPDANGYWNDLDKITWHQDLPLSSTSMYAQWEVMKLAKQQGLKVLLDGQGADETLGGYGIFTGVFLMGLLKRVQLRQLYNESKYLRKHRSVKPWNELGRAAFQYFPTWLQLKVRKRERLGIHFLKEPYREHLHSMSDSGKGHTFREMSLQTIRHGMQDLLRYEDRNSMAFSIESRVPFLDHRLVEFSLALPDREKMKNGWTKYILRRILDRKLPDSVVWRKDKKGFITPQESWMHELKPQLTEYLHSAKIPEVIDRRAVLESLNTTGLNKTQVSEFWKMVSLIKWFEVFALTE